MQEAIVRIRSKATCSALRGNTVSTELRRLVELPNLRVRQGPSTTWSRRLVGWVRTPLELPGSVAREVDDPTMPPCVKRVLKEGIFVARKSRSAARMPPIFPVKNCCQIGLNLPYFFHACNELLYIPCHPNKYQYKFYESSYFGADEPVWLEDGIGVRARARARASLTSFSPILCHMYLWKYMFSVVSVLKEFRPLFTTYSSA